MAKLELIFHSEVGAGVHERALAKVFRKFCEVLADRLGEYLGERSGVVNLILVNDERIREINREYRSKDKPTDVISFAYMENEEWADGGGELSAGDIFISVDTAERQAEEKGHSLEKELKILFVHGLLHLFGFDHNTDEEEAEMEGWAGRVL